ncbi:hypothetical protein H072_7715 [Dactylellina haptotyla CBS 200.50]|uniref:Uncharacterized protein n=1 Tax=Dactylellina haptotyla (strain CBS 200.50) TaxID=1284197 RepID=S8BTG1_DACHA|nr:hypothetical protein H072_7715 [Dactylellina haptotyla CBS 200.50]
MLATYCLPEITSPSRYQSRPRERGALPPLFSKTLGHHRLVGGPNFIIYGPVSFNAPPDGPAARADVERGPESGSPAAAAAAANMHPTDKSEKAFELLHQAHFRAFLVFTRNTNQYELLITECISRLELLECLSLPASLGDMANYLKADILRSEANAHVARLKATTTTERDRASSANKVFKIRCDAEDIMKKISRDNIFFSQDVKRMERDFKNLHSDALKADRGHSAMALLPTPEVQYISRNSGSSTSVNSGNNENLEIKAGLGSKPPTLTSTEKTVEIGPETGLFGSDPLADINNMIRRVLQCRITVGDKVRSEIDLDDSAILLDEPQDIVGDLRVIASITNLEGYPFLLFLICCSGQCNGCKIW